jgi:hypothetical protein
VTRTAIAAVLVAGCCGEPASAPAAAAPVRRAPQVTAEKCDVGCTRIRLVDNLGWALAIASAAVTVDGIESFALDTATPMSEGDTIEVFRGELTPGEHDLRIEMKLRSRGYGVFSLSLYQLVVRSRQVFTVEAAANAFDLVAYSRGGVTTPIEERPAVRIVRR